jgi:hypothetical protein
MDFGEWEKKVPEKIKNDALWTVKSYKLALFLSDLAWLDCTKLMSDRRTIGISDQLFRSSGSVSSNIAEGFSRGSGKDRARFYARLLLTTVPQQRGYSIKESSEEYALPQFIIDDIPLP